MKEKVLPIDLARHKVTVLRRNQIWREKIQRIRRNP